ncbi:hypothetical protein DFH29DRAFT_928294 [Suillus ampliporus]|nr:hypothetical protein DFH29DRAFT_928294 [Suillus ampliporus]
MEPPTPFPLYKLPTELVFLILGYAAEPTFSQAETYDSQNPYASALVLCHVSRLFRRAALPKLLHTVLLSAPHSLPAFVNALQMQKGYAEKKHHLHFEYAPRIHRMWIAEIPRTIPLPPTVVSHVIPPPAPSALDIDFSLLAPVLLAAESLKIDSKRLFLLVGCLRHAWNSRILTNVDDARSPLPWSTKILTLSSDIQWLDLQNSPQGSAFLASISHILCLCSPSYFILTIFDRSGSMGPRDYKLPPWMTCIPWASFTGLQTISVALPRIIPPFYLRLVKTGNDHQVQVLTFSASLVVGHRAPREIRDSTETADGRILLDDVSVTLPRGCVHLCSQCDDWEKGWAGVL